MNWAILIKVIQQTAATATALCWLACVNCSTCLSFFSRATVAMRHMNENTRNANDTPWRHFTFSTTCTNMIYACRIMSIVFCVCVVACAYSWSSICFNVCCSLISQVVELVCILMIFCEFFEYFE